MNKTDIALAVGATAGLGYFLYAHGGVGPIDFGPYAGAPLADSPLSGLGIFAGTGTLMGLGAYRLVERVESLYTRIIGERTPPPVISYSMPPTPYFAEEFAWVVGEVHNGHYFNYHTFGTDDQPYLTIGDPQKYRDYAQNPEWFVIPAKALYTGVLVLGSTGASKTAGVARPFLKQFFRWAKDDAQRKPAALLGDYKASLVEPALEAAKEAGREKDIYLIGPGQDVLWNPVYEPGLSPLALVPRLMSAQENLSGSSPTPDSQWIFDNNARLLEGAIGLLRMCQPHGYFTLIDINGIVHKARDARMQIAEGSGANVIETVVKALDDLKAAAVDNPEFTEAAWKYYAGKIANVMAQPERHLGTILNQAEGLLGFWDDPAIADKYCPTREDLLERGFKGFNWALDEGRLVVMDCPVGAFGSASRCIAMFLKLAFQRAMLDRPYRWRTDPTANKIRPALFMLDEYQEYVSTSGNEGDDQFFALARESKCISVMLTQALSSLVKVVGDVKAENIMANLRTKVIQVQSEPKDRDYAAKVCGMEWREIENSSISGSVQDAKMSGAGDYLGDKTSVSESVNISMQEMEIFNSTVFRNVPTLTAIVDTYDGNTMIPATFVRLKAFFESWEKTHKEVVEGMRWKAYEAAYGLQAEAAKVTDLIPPDTEDLDELQSWLDEHQEEQPAEEEVTTC